MAGLIGSGVTGSSAQMLVGLDADGGEAVVHADAGEKAAGEPIGEPSSPHARLCGAYLAV